MPTLINKITEQVVEFEAEVGNFLKEICDPKNWINTDQKIEFETKQLFSSNEHESTPLTSIIEPVAIVDEVVIENKQAESTESAK